MIFESHRAAQAIPGAFWKVLEVIGVNIKQAILELQKLERQHMDAIANGDASKEEMYDGMIGRIQDACNLWVDMAKAAIAYAEFQADAGRETSMDGASYIRERVKLWNAFLAARAKVKGASNEST